MKEIKIISKTGKGVLAMEHHIQESMKLKKPEKLMWKMMGYTQDVTENPYTIILTIKNRAFQQLLKPEDMIRKIDEALNENGAIKNRDYYITVK